MQQLTSLFLILMLSSSLFGQVELGVKAGVHSYDLSKIAELQIMDGDLDFSLQPNSASYGFQFGLYSRVKLLGFFVEPGLLLNSTKFSYELSDGDIVDAIREESFLNLDIPMVVGIPLIPFLKAKVGAVGHVSLDSSSDLLDIVGYSQTISRLKYGYLLGFGLDIVKLRLEIMYEGNLDNFGDHITLNGNTFEFDKKPSRFLINVGYAF